jgi:hypothetical protein
VDKRPQLPDDTASDAIYFTFYSVVGLLNL